MAKRGKNRRGGNRNPKKMKLDEDVDTEDMDDEIDAFHKQRDKIPLDINADDADLNSDDEQPVFDYEGIKDEDDDEDEDEDVDDDDGNLKGLAAKIARQSKYLKQKYGGLEDDEMNDEAEDEAKGRTVWSRKKSLYYNADNPDFELQSSDDEAPMEEEEAVIELQKKHAESMTMGDFGLQDDEDESDEEPTLEEISKGKMSRSTGKKEDENDTGPVYEEVKKDLSALSREEQMDVVYSSAPELVGLLSELNEALKQLENQVDPLLSKVAKKESTKKEGMNYMEVKRLLLLAYCQSITFYLLLKSEGQPVRDHPVIARLVEIKSLLDKMKELDQHLPSELEHILNEKNDIQIVTDLTMNKIALPPDAAAEVNGLKHHQNGKAEAPKLIEPAEQGEKHSMKDAEKVMGRAKKQNQPVSQQNVKMLQVRAALEEKLKRKGVSSSNVPKADMPKKHRQKVLTGQLETFDDFDDEAMDMEGANHSNVTLSSKLSKAIAARDRKSKIISGDADLPKRDDLGERRRKYELRVLARAGIKSAEDKDEGDFSGHENEADENNGDGSDESEDEFYKQIKQQRAAKLAMKEQKYSRTLEPPSDMETTVDGKRLITTQMEKNRGLTRNRKKLTKNPRKKYKLKFQDAVTRRKGQVRDIRKPAGPYGGEGSGINANISRSIRFKG